jgi:hypothetical protein
MVGYWNYHKGEYSKALEEYTQSIKLSNYKNISPWSHYWRGMANKMLNNLKDSLEDFIRLEFQFF